MLRLVTAALVERDHHKFEIQPLLQDSNLHLRAEHAERARIKARALFGDVLTP